MAEKQAGNVDFTSTINIEADTVISNSRNVKTTFVIGLPRSGTTLLASLLARGDSILSLSEPFLSRTVRRHWLLNGLYFNKIRGHRISPPRNCDDIGFLSYLNNFAYGIGFTSLIIKETYRIAPFLENTALLNRIVSGDNPTVAIIRHPYDTASSTIRMFRQFHGMKGMLMRFIISDLPAISKDREVVEWFTQNWLSFLRWCKQKKLFVVRYENLVKNPVSSLQGVFERFEIPVKQVLLDKNTPGCFSGVSGDLGVLKQGNKELFVRPVGKSNQLKPEFLEIIKMECSRVAEEFGYSL